MTSIKTPTFPYFMDAIYKMMERQSAKLEKMEAENRVFMEQLYAIGFIQSEDNAVVKLNELLKESNKIVKTMMETLAEE
jgi:trans-2-enoyl-CoA reductase